MASAVWLESCSQSIRIASDNDENNTYSYWVAHQKVRDTSIADPDPVASTID